MLSLHLAILLKISLSSSIISNQSRYAMNTRTKQFAFIKKKKIWRFVIWNSELLTYGGDISAMHHL